MKMLRKRKGMPRSRMGDIMEDLGGVGGMGSKAKTVRAKKKSTSKQKTSGKKTKSSTPIKEVRSKDMARALKNQKPAPKTKAKPKSGVSLKKAPGRSAAKAKAAGEGKYAGINKQKVDYSGNIAKAKKARDMGSLRDNTRPPKNLEEKMVRAVSKGFLKSHPKTKALTGSIGAAVEIARSERASRKRKKK